MSRSHAMRAAVCLALAGVTFCELVTDVVVAADLRQQVEKLFGRTTNVSPSALQKARDRYAAIQADGDGRMWVDYAFALVLIEQQRLAEAGKKLDHVLQAKPRALAPYRARAWVRLQRKEYQAALTDLESLAEALASAKSDEEPTAEQCSTARFLGSAELFLEGPAASKRTEPLVAATKQRVEKKLDKPLLKEYEQGRQQTIAQQAELLREVENMKEEVVKLQAEQLVAHKVVLKEAEDAVNTKVDARTKEAQSEVVELLKQFSKLQFDLAEVQLRATPLQVQRAAAQAEIRLLTELTLQGDNSYSVSYSNIPRAQFLKQWMSQLEIQLAPILAEESAITLQIDNLRSKHADLFQQHRAELEKLAEARKQVAASQKKLDGKMQQHEKANPTGNSPETRALNAQWATFSTYQLFPVAQEKAQVLRALDRTQIAETTNHIENLPGRAGSHNKEQ